MNTTTPDPEPSQAPISTAQRGLPGPVVFVLGGGSSLGAIQVGMLRALSEAQISPDAVVGTSVGALNGAILAAHPRDAVERLSQVWTQMQRADVFPGSIIGSAWRLTTTRSHAVRARGLRDIAARTLRASTFAELELPFAAVTLDLTSGSTRVLTQGDLVQALLASAAIPGVFPVVDLDGHHLVDGGVVANVPLSQSRVFPDVGSLVVLDCTLAPEPGPQPHVGDVLGATTRIQMRAQVEAALPAVASEVPVVYLPAPTPRTVSPFDFDQSDALIKEAYDLARTFIDATSVEGPGLYGEPFARYTGRSAAGSEALIRP